MYLPCNTEKSPKIGKNCIGGTISYLPRNTENIAQQVQFRTCRAIRKILHSRYDFVPAVQYGKNSTGGTISYLTCNHKGYLQKPCLQNDCTKAALFPTYWRGGKQACLLNTPRQAEGLRRRVLATALRSNPFQDSSEGESPPGVGHRIAPPCV